jgi:purine-binding chemotaxis protein CheW
MVADPPVCLFRCHSLPFAVTVNTVAEIVETAALVRMGLCPDCIVGLCPYHREVVPVVALGTESRGAEPLESKPSTVGKTSPDAVLIMQTSQGMWGIVVDRDGTVITTKRASHHEPRKGTRGVVTIGIVHHEETVYSLIDAEATWHGLREEIVGWFSRIHASVSKARFREPAIDQDVLASPRLEESLEVLP